MHMVRRWLIYRRLLNELADARDPTFGDFAVCRCAIRDFAWHCAKLEVGRCSATNSSAIGAHD